MTDLRAKAEAARDSAPQVQNLGRWFEFGKLLVSAASGDKPAMPVEMAAFIAAASPDVVLGLLDERDKLKGLLHSGLTCDMHYCELHEMAYQRGEGAPPKCPYCEVDSLLDRVEALREELLDLTTWAAPDGEYRCSLCKRGRPRDSDAPDDHEVTCLLRREP